MTKAKLFEIFLFDRSLNRITVSAKDYFFECTFIENNFFRQSVLLMKAVKLRNMIFLK